MPNTKRGLLDLTGVRIELLPLQPDLVAQCITAAGTLGLAHLGAGATVADRQKRISDYLSRHLSLRAFPISVSPTSSPK
jgi:hypothetical protein